MTEKSEPSFDEFYASLGDAEKGVASIAFNLALKDATDNPTSVVSRVKHESYNDGFNDGKSLGLIWLRGALKRLKFYADGEHDKVLSGKIDWEKERKALKKKNYSLAGEAYNGDEFFVEDGSFAARYVELLERKIAEIEQIKPSEAMLKPMSAPEAMKFLCDHNGSQYFYDSQLALLRAYEQHIGLGNPQAKPFQENVDTNPCPTCKGSRGFERELSSTSGTWVKCSDCNGTGVKGMNFHSDELATSNKDIHERKRGK